MTSVHDEAEAALAYGNNNYGYIEIEAEALRNLLAENERLRAQIKPPTSEDRDWLMHVVARFNLSPGGTIADNGSYGPPDVQARPGYWRMAEKTAARLVSDLIAAGFRRQEPHPVTDEMVEAARAWLTWVPSDRVLRAALEAALKPGPWTPVTEEDK